MAVEIGALRALLSLDSAAFEKGAKRAQASMSNLERNLKNAGDRIGAIGKKMTAGLTLPIVGGAGLAVRSSLKTIDAQAKMAQSFETSVSSLQTLQRAADLAGISQGELEGSMLRLTRRLSLAEQGAGPAVKALEQLQLSASDFSGLEMDDRIKLIQERMGKLVPEAERAGVASQLFGDRTGIAMARLDAATIDTAAQQVERFGVAVTDIEADQIEAANDAMSSLGLASRGLANQVTAALAPALKYISERVADAAAWFAQLTPLQKNLTLSVAGFAAAIGPVTIGLGFLVSSVGALVPLFAALASPIAAVFVGIVAVGVAARALYKNWDELKARFPVLQSLADFGGAIAEAWSNLPAIKWALLIPALSWAKYIPVIRWVPMAGALAWSALVAPLAWTARLIPKVGWFTLAGGLSWSALIKPLIWTARFIPVIGWGILAGQLAWSLLIKPLGWADWIPKVNWSDWIPEVDWGRIFSGAQGAGSQARRAARRTGAQISEGLAEGIRSGGSSGRRAARDTMEGVIDESKDAAETRSPSRVFMRIGRDLMAGLGIGISENADTAIGQAREAMQGVSTEAKTSDLEGIFSGLTSSLASAAVGMTSFRDVAVNALQQIGQSILTSGLNSLFGALGGGGGGGLSSLFSGLFGGFRASGGSVSSGKAYVVGEQGPELFAPNVSGSIIPNHALNASGGGVTVNFAPNIDARNADVAGIMHLKEELARMKVEFPARVVDAVRTAQKRRHLA